MDESYFDIDLPREQLVIVETNDKETCFERLHRWANYDPVLFVGCFGFVTFVFVIVIFIIVWAIYNK